MAKNDLIIIDSIIENEIQKKPGEKQGEIFEKFCFEQILKNYDLTEDEIQKGNVDGRNDGGIDGFFIFINGHYLTEFENISIPKSSILIEIWMITCKYGDTFLFKLHLIIS